MSSGISTVTVTNNTGSTILGGAVFHTVGLPVITGPAQFVQVSQFTGVADGATTGPATTQVEDGLADYWAAVFSISGDPSGGYRILAGALNTEPYKKCNTPTNGTTQIVIGPSNGDAYPVTIYTNEPGGGGDGSCSSALLTLTQFEDSPFAELFNSVLHALLDGEG